MYRNVVDKVAGLSYVILSVKYRLSAHELWIHSRLNLKATVSSVCIT